LQCMSVMTCELLLWTLLRCVSMSQLSITIDTGTVYQSEPPSYLPYLSRHSSRGIYNTSTRSALGPCRGSTETCATYIVDLYSRRAVTYATHRTLYTLLCTTRIQRLLCCDVDTGQLLKFKLLAQFWAQFEAHHRQGTVYNILAHAYECLLVIDVHINDDHHFLRYNILYPPFGLILDTFLRIFH